MYLYMSIVETLVLRLVPEVKSFSPRSYRAPCPRYASHLHPVSFSFFFFFFLLLLSNLHPALFSTGARSVTQPFSFSFPFIGFFLIFATPCSTTLLPFSILPHCLFLQLSRGTALVDHTHIHCVPSTGSLFLFHPRPAPPPLEA